MLARRSKRWLTFLIFAACLSGQATFADEARPNRIKLEYVPPTNPRHQAIYDILRKNGSLEKLQQIFSPFRFPVDLTIKTAGCDGEANAWYERPQMKPAITICYEYLDEDIKIPKGVTAGGVSASDAVVGQFLYVAAHELGHAVFDLLDVPIFGNLEDAADQFAAYMILQFGKDQGRKFIAAAAYSYREDMLTRDVNVPLKAFSSNHSPPQARFFNLLCLAYGADPETFADVRTYLPASRANGCSREYREVAFAFKQLVSPHLDAELTKRVLQKNWLPGEERPLPLPH